MKHTALIAITLIFSVAFATFRASIISIATTIRIVTPEPAEDFAVQCEKTVKSIISFHGPGSSRVVDEPFMAKSGVDLSCGFIIVGHNSHARVSHPIYQQSIVNINSAPKDNGNGVEIIEFVHWKERNKQALGLYEMGYWDNKPDSIDSYLKNISKCSITKDYSSIFVRDRKKAYQLLKDRYYDEILECNREHENIVHKHGRSTKYYYYAKYGRHGQVLANCALYPQHCENNKEYLPERAILLRNDFMWGPQTWNLLHSSGAIKEKALFAVLTKKSFTVSYGHVIPYYEDESLNHPIEKVAWLLVDAYTRQDVEDTLGHGFTVFDTEPTWLSEYKTEKYIRDCMGNILHLDADVHVISKELWRHIHDTTNNNDWHNNCLQIDAALPRD